ncbi:MAG: DnaA N-terminal domain-containing protein, partial [Polyangiales bacterium]
MSPESYETWLAPVQCKDVRDDTVILRIPNRFYA